MPNQRSTYDASKDAMGKLGGLQKGEPTAPPMVPSGKDFPMQGTGAKDNETDYYTTGYYKAAEAGEAKEDPNE